MLDIGCGHGKLTNHFSSKGKVISIDISREMLKIAKSENSNAMYIQCDAHHLCFKDQSVTAAVSSRTLMHLSNIKKFIKEISRVSSCDIAFDFPNFFSFSLIERIGRKIAMFLPYSQEPYKGFMPYKIKKVLRDEHFKNILISKHFFCPIALHRLINNPRISKNIERFFVKIGLLKLISTYVFLYAKKN